MDDVWGATLALGFVVLAIAIVSVFVYRSYQRDDAEAEVWRDAAGQLGLEFVPGGVVRQKAMAGGLPGAYVTVKSVVRERSEVSKHSTSFRVQFPPSGPTVRMTQKNLGSFVGKKIGTIKDVEVGSNTFDDLVVVEGDDEEALRSHLTPERQRVVMELCDRYQRISVTEESLSVEINGTMQTVEQITTTVDELVEAALVLSGVTDD